MMMMSCKCKSTLKLMTKSKIVLIVYALLRLHSRQIVEELNEDDVQM
jgi:hypothetical protein